MRPPHYYLERTSLEARLESTEEEGEAVTSWENLTISLTDLDLRSSTQRPRVVPTRQVCLVLVMSSVTVILEVRRLGRSSSLHTPSLSSVSSSRTERISQPGRRIFLFL